jgi:uncharacterized protein (TIGR02271 family)
MKLKWIANNTQVIVSTLGVAVFAGCSSENPGGSETTSAAPPYRESAVGGTAETQESTSSTSSAQTSGTQTIPLYKEQVNVGTRQVPDSQVTIRKVVKTETVNQPVTLTKQTLVIDRQPSPTGAQPSGTAFQDQQITIPLSHQEPVVSTQVVPNGQVVATTKSDTQQTTVQKQVRSEDVVVDKGNAQNVVVSDNMTKNSSQSSQSMGAATEPGGQASGSSSGTSGPITDITTLTGCSDPNSISGRQVQLVNVKVDQVAGQYLYITDNAGKDACVRLDQPAENVHPGDMVNISGTAMDMSTMGQHAESMPQAASGQRVCIQAQSVQVAK